MKKVSPLKIKIRNSDGIGLFHDTRADVIQLARAINEIIEKQNETISVVNKLIERLEVEHG